MDDLHSRIENLERGSKFHKMINIVVIIIMTMTLLYLYLGRGSQDTVRAKALELVDSDGRLLFKVDQRYAGGRLRIFNLYGNTIFEVDSLTSGAHVLVSNEDGKEHLSILSGGSIEKKMYITSDVPIDAAYPKYDYILAQRKWPIMQVMDSQGDEPTQD